MKNRLEQQFVEGDAVAFLREVSQLSNCHSRKIGALLIRDREAISFGFNTPLIKHESGVCPRKEMGFKSGEGLKYCPAIHAEQDAIMRGLREVGAKLVEESTLWCLCGYPCPECAKIIITAGIRSVVGVESSDWDDTEYNFSLTKKMFEENGVSFRLERE